MTNKTNQKERFIFSRMVEGDKEAFRFFFDRYYSDLCNFINIYIHNTTVSEEIAQDIFIYFWEKRSELKIGSSVKSYLLGASKNKSLNYIRNEKTQLDILKRLSERSYTNSEMPDKVMDSNQLREVINKAVENLPDRCKEVYILAKEENLSYKEIADQLDISVKTVEAQMGKAFKKLREQLKPYYNDIFILFLSILLS